MTVENAARQERARIAAERLRLAVAEHAAEPPCGEPGCLLHRPRITEAKP